jgi:flagellar hook-length control protein FliK
MNVPDIAVNARAAPPGPKTETAKSEDSGQSFQDSLDSKVQSSKASQDQAVEKHDEDVQADRQSQKESEGKKTEGVAVVTNPTAYVINFVQQITQQVKTVNTPVQPLLVQGSQKGQIVQNKPELLDEKGLKKVEVKSNPLTFENIADNAKSKAGAQTAAKGQEIGKTGENQAVSGKSATQEQIKAAVVELKSQAGDQEKKIDTGASGDKLVLVDPENNIYAVAQAFAAKTEALAESKPSLAISQVSQGVQDMVDTGKSMLKLQLYPENMGRIEIKLVSNAEGVQVTMTADRPSTGRLLESNLNQLQQSLMDMGVKVGGMSVGTNASQENPAAWQFAKKQGHPVNLGFNNDGQADLASAWQPVNSLSALDARV